MRVNKAKWFWAWEFEEEEKWLNEMSAKGLQLVGVSLGSYTFEEGAAGEYQYRIELLKKSVTHPDSITYIRFLEETGAEHVATFNRWIYIRKKCADGPFDLFSSLDSKIEHLKRIRRLFWSVTPLLLFAIVINIIAIIQTRAFSNGFTVTILAALAILLGYGIFDMSRRKNKLKKERQIRE